MATELRPILIIEDNHDDYETVVRIFERIGVKNPVYRIVMGLDYSDYLNRRMSHQKRANEPLPALILLDLRLPAIDGLSILRDLKGNPQFRSIPVVIFSTAEDPREIAECYEAGANAYMVKHIDPDRFTAAVRSLCDYWLNNVSLPELG